ncbi:unnamed protein product [Peniophora sp. CBMAI 1063]|nr:unnamed protein product [Peniophora sp. CBMAI 1063]
MDEAHLQRMAKAELETLARAKGMGDEAIFHLNKPRLIEAFLDHLQTLDSESVPPDVESGRVTRSSRRPSTVVIEAAVDGNMKRRRTRQASRRSYGGKKRRVEDGNVADAEGHDEPVEGLSKLGPVDAPTDSSKDICLKQGYFHVTAAGEDVENQTNGDKAIPGELTVNGAFTVPDDRAASSTDLDPIAANTETDDATLLTRRGETVCSADGLLKSPRSIRGSEKGDGQVAANSERRSPVDDESTKKLYDIARDNMETAGTLLELLDSDFSSVSSALTKAFTTVDGSSSRATILHILSTTSNVLIKISSTIRTASPTTTPFIHDRFHPDLQELSLAQSELSSLTSIISRGLTSAHAMKRKWTKGYRWEKVFELLHTLMNGMDAAKTHISMMTDAEDEVNSNLTNVNSDSEDATDGYEDGGHVAEDVEDSDASPDHEACLDQPDKSGETDDRARSVGRARKGSRVKDRADGPRVSSHMPGLDVLASRT